MLNIAVAMACHQASLQQQSPPRGAEVDRGCPADREDLGRATWTLLHTTAAYCPDQPTRKQQKQLAQFMHNLVTFYPCHECAKEFREL